MDWKYKFVDMLYPLNASLENMEGAYLLKLMNLPERVYKYREVNPCSLQNLQEGKIWLADPGTLNDPYECAHYANLQDIHSDVFRRPFPKIVDLLTEGGENPDVLNGLEESENPLQKFIEIVTAGEPEHLKKQWMAALTDLVRQQYEKMNRKNSDRVRASFKLCSFSERVDSTLMWAHYAKYHSGFCIEYNIKALAPEDYRSRFLYPVIYRDDVFDATEHLSRGVASPEFNALYMNLAGIYKSTDWSYEREWRLLFSNSIIAEPQTYNMPKPTCVYLGSHIKEPDQDAIVRICREIQVPVMKMRHSVQQYKMIPLELAVADRS